MLFYFILKPKVITQRGYTMKNKNRILGYFLSMRWILLTQMNTYVGFDLLAQQEISWTCQKDKKKQ